METADRWVKQNHDMTSVGVRKLLRAWLMELIDLVLAKEEGKKVVYFGFPSIVGPGMATDLATAMELAAFAQGICATSEDHAEAVAAFQEKREPVFRGR